MMSLLSRFRTVIKLGSLAVGLLVLTACGASGSPDTVPGPYATFLQDIQLFNQDHPIAIFETNVGTFAVELYKTQLPLTVDHFTKLAVAGRYDGSSVYNLIDNFAVYLGDKSGSMTEALDVLPIDLEIHPDIRHDSEGMIGLVHQSGIQCATSGNKEQCAQDALNSAKSFFYITVAPTPNLNNTYATFGKVVKGMQIVKGLRRGTILNKVVVVAK